MLLVEAEHDLRLDGARLQAEDDILLDLREWPADGGDLARRENANVALLVDRLRRPIDELPG